MYHSTLPRPPAERFSDLCRLVNKTEMQQFPLRCLLPGDDTADTAEGLLSGDIWEMVDEGCNCSQKRGRSPQTFLFPLSTSQTVCVKSKIQSGAFTTPLLWSKKPIFPSNHCIWNRRITTNCF